MKNISIRLMVVIPPLFQDGIRRMLEREKDIEVVAEASTYIQAITLVEQKKPDVLFFDTAIAHIDIARIEPIRQKSPETKLLLLIHTLDEETSRNAIALGVREYLTEKSSAEQFVKTIRAAAKNGTPTERRVVTEVLVQLLPVLGLIIPVS